MNRTHHIFTIIGIWLAISVICGDVHARQGILAKPFETLQSSLIKDGFDPERIKILYGDQRAEFEIEGVSLYFVHKEGKLNYDQFLKSSNIRKAKKYMLEHKTDLEKAQKTYGVDKEVITAILLVETRLGKYTGKRTVFNTLSSMAALEDPAVKQGLWKEISSSSRMTRAKYDKKAGRKSKWAYNELKAFLTYTRNESIDPHVPIGSYAGAMGFCQFLPSNIKPLARDGNKDGRVDLYTHPDAIMSIASYLSHHGWKPGTTGKQAYKAVYRYNPSKYYTNTILKVSRKLKGKK